MTNGARISHRFKLGLKLIFAGAAASAWATSGSPPTEPNSPPNSPAGTEAATPRTQTLTAEEIQRALTRMREYATNSRPAGTWRLIEISDDPEIAVPNTVYEWRGPEGQFLLRKEITQHTKVPKSKSHSAVHHFHLSNKEGYWAIWSNIAIHYPNPRDGHLRTAKEDPEEPQPVASTGFSVDFDIYDLAMFRLTGKRIQSDARARLLLVAEAKDDARAFMEAEFKRKMPFLMRPFLTKSKLKEVVSVLLPARVETVTEEQTGMVIYTRYFAKDGSLMMEIHGWEHCDDLPSDAYAPPIGVKRVYPKTENEARRLESKAREEEGNSHK